MSFYMMQQLLQSTMLLIGGNFIVSESWRDKLSVIRFFFLAQDLESFILFFRNSSSILRSVFLASSYILIFSLILFLSPFLLNFGNQRDSLGGERKSSNYESFPQGVKQLALMIVFNYFDCIKILCIEKHQQQALFKKDILFNFIFNDNFRYKIYHGQSPRFIIIFKMISRFICLAILCVSLTNSLKFVVNVNRNEGNVCFFHYLTINEKYYYQTSSRGHTQYRMEVQRNNLDGRWEPVIAKDADSSIESVSKLADKQGTYMFCVSNLRDDPIKVNINFMAGLQMANLEHLPNTDDQENLHREIDWLENQKKTLFDVINRIEGVRTTANDLNSKMNTSYIVLAVFGLIGVLGVNFVFYTQTRKTLKDRKLI